MKKVSFTILGTHKGPSTNPLPKLKMTGKQHWMPKAREYVKYKEHVVGSFLAMMVDQKLIDHRDFRDFLYIFGDRKPINLGDKNARMDIKIEWASKVHGDPENIFGAIADALFENDKHLAGSFDFCYSETKNAKVNVEITFY